MFCSCCSPGAGSKEFNTPSAPENGFLTGQEVEEESNTPQKKKKKNKAPVHRGAESERVSELGDGNMGEGGPEEQGPQTPVQARGGGRGKKAKVEGDATPLLFNAAKKADLKELEKALKGGADLNQTDDDGFTPGMYMLRPPNKNMIKSLQWLLDKKAELEAKDPSGRTLLHQLASRQQVEEAALLLDRARWMSEIKDDKGDTALHIAIQADSVEIAETLLAKLGRHILIETDAQGMTPFQIGCASGALSVLQWLVREQKGVVSLDQRLGGEHKRGTPLHLAARGGHVGVCMYLARLKGDRKSVV